MPDPGPDSASPETTQEIVLPGASAQAVKTLVVDDESSVRRAIGHLLSGEDHEVHEADGPAAAEALLEAGLRPDVVVTDYRMPGGDGISFLRRVRITCPHAQRILISAHADLHMVEEAINDGTVHRFLTKPWEFETFLTTVRSAAAQVRITEERDRFFRELTERHEELKRLASSLEAAVDVRTAQLERAKRSWERTFDVFAEPLSVITDDYRVERTNLAFAEAASLDIRDVPGEACHKTLFGRDAPCETCPVPGLGRGSQSAAGEVVDESGEQTYEVSAYLLQSAEEADGTARHVVLYKDITERKKLGQQLVQSEKMAALGLLSGEIAHEINNPVGIILSFSQLALRARTIDEDAKLKSFLTEIEASARRCKSIIQNLLSFARPSRPKSREPLDLDDLIGRTLQIVAAQLRGAGVQTTVDVPKDLPAPLGQPDQLQQVLLNLVTNATHALEGPRRDKAITIRAATATHRGADAVVVEVADNGPGLPPEAISRVFDPFFTTKPEGKGTGLGLSTCYRIISDHGGHIEAVNGAEGGAIFRVILPVAR